MTTYAPTIATGEQRRRTRYIGIRTPLGQAPQVEVLEQEVIRTQAGERVLEDLGQVAGIGALTLEEMATAFPLRNPETDAEIGGTATPAQALALIYSWVRSKQLARDAAANTQPQEGPQP